MGFDIINPLELPNWDDLVLATGKASFFHSVAWARVLHDSYGYKPLYFTTFENGNLVSLMPVMEVKSWLTGKRGVSLPFTDFCDSFAQNGKAFQEGVEEVEKYGGNQHWKTLEWRGNGEYFVAASPCASYFTHSLELSCPEDQMFERFKSNTRRNIQKAVKEGVRIEIGNSLIAMETYYTLHCRTRKNHGLPPQPFSFFKKIHEHAVSSGKGFTALAFIKDLCVAGAVFLHFGNMAIYKFGASDKAHQHVRPNNLVMWEAIRECARRGCRQLSFGRTDPDNEGLLQFKRGWGTTESELHCYRYDLKKKSFVTQSMGVKGFYNSIFGMMPVPVLRVLGAALYKHLG
jgi:hypothetical protein